MTCNIIRTDSLLLQHSERGDSDRDERGLRVFRKFEGLFRTFEAHLGERKANRVVCLLERTLRDRKGFGQRPAHSRKLRSLTGEKKCSFAHEITILSAYPVAMSVTSAVAFFALLFLG